VCRKPQGYFDLNVLSESRGDLELIVRCEQLGDLELICVVNHEGT